MSEMYIECKCRNPGGFSVMYKDDMCCLHQIWLRQLGCSDKPTAGYKCTIIKVKQKESEKGSVLNCVVLPLAALCAHGASKPLPYLQDRSPPGGPVSTALGSSSVCIPFARLFPVTLNLTHAAAACAGAPAWAEDRMPPSSRQLTSARRLVCPSLCRSSTGEAQPPRTRGRIPDGSVIKQLLFAEGLVGLDGVVGRRVLEEAG
eukprot:351893-Chlamydomonas_euryale.AAC.7